MKAAKSKLIIGLVFLGILTLVLGFVHTFDSMGFMVDRDMEDAVLKGTAVRNALEDIDRISSQIEKDLLEKNLFRLDLIAVSLRAEGENESGALQPSFSGDGFLFRLDGDVLEMPEDYPKHLMPLPEFIKGDRGELFLNMQQNPETGGYTVVSMYYVRVKDDCFYAEWKTAGLDEQSQYFDFSSYMKGIEKTFNTGIIVISDLNSSKEYMNGMIIYSSDGLPVQTEPAQYGFTEEQLERAIAAGKSPNQVETFALGESVYGLTAYELKGNSTLVCLLSPLLETISRALEQTNAVCLFFAVIGITYLIWVFCVFILVRDHGLTEGQKKMFSPRAIRRKSMLFAAGTAALVCLVTAYTGCLFSLHSRSAIVDRALDVLDSQMENSDRRRQAADESRTDLYLQHAALIRDLLVRNPSLQTKDVLAEMNSLIGADYIILYDQYGREMLCSKNLYGLELGESEESGTGKFRKLLRGVEAVSAVPAVDELTGLERELYGVTFPLDGVDNGCGALLLAVDPAGISSLTSESTDDLMKMLVTQGMLCMRVTGNSSGNTPRRLVCRRRQRGTGTRASIRSTAVLCTQPLPKKTVSSIAILLKRRMYTAV